MLLFGCTSYNVHTHTCAIHIHVQSYVCVTAVLTVTPVCAKLCSLTLQKCLGIFKQLKILKILKGNLTIRAFIIVLPAAIRQKMMKLLYMAAIYLHTFISAHK